MNGLPVHVSSNHLMATRPKWWSRTNDLVIASPTF